MEHENLNTPQNPPLQQTAVMRSASSVQMRLEELQLDYTDCKSWYDKAFAKYEADRKYWGSGEADPNEYLEASRQLELIKIQVKLLEWVLGGALV
jgi:hypothetical protein